VFFQRRSIGEKCWQKLKTSWSFVSGFQLPFQLHLKNMLLEILSPEASLFKGEITSVSVPGLDGSFQILNNHAPIVSLLQKGTVSITAPSLEL
jgi:hypothetical protein